MRDGLVLLLLDGDMSKGLLLLLLGGGMIKRLLLLLNLMNYYC